MLYRGERGGASVEIQVAVTLLVQGPPGQRVVLALTYFLGRHKSEMLQLDMLDDYKSEGGHGKPYVVE